MLKRYALPHMWALWQPITKLEHWLKCELAVIQAKAELGLIPLQTFELIRDNAKIKQERMETLEKKHHHDMIGAYEDVKASLEEAGLPQPVVDEYHKGPTSYDIEDPALVLMMRQAVTHVYERLQNLHGILLLKASAHKWTLMMGITHGQDAQPATFGHLLLVWAHAIKRSMNRLELVMQKELSEAKMSGAIGNYAEMNPAVEQRALLILGLRPAEVETQILQRDRHASVINTLAVAAGSMDQAAYTLWMMMQSSRRELQEPRTEDQRGSSAMPQKKNPIRTERVRGQARVVRAQAHIALENIATPDFRAIEQSSAEREAIPTAFATTEFMAKELAAIIDGLVVFPDRMKRNLEVASLGVWACQRIRDTLIEKGVKSKDAYEYTQACGFEAVEKGVHMREILNDIPIDALQRIAEEFFTEEELDAFFDPLNYVRRGVEHMFGVESPQLSLLGAASEPSPQPV